MPEEMELMSSNHLTEKEFTEALKSYKAKLEQMDDTQLYDMYLWYLKNITPIISNAPIDESYEISRKRRNAVFNFIVRSLKKRGIGP